MGIRYQKSVDWGAYKNNNATAGWRLYRFHGRRNVITKSVHGQLYKYLTEDEALDLGIAFVQNWRQAKSGDWALLDDGYIAQVMWARETTVNENGRPVQTIRFPHGTYFGRRSQRATSEDRECVYSIAGKRTDFTDPTRSLSAKERKFVLLYVECFDVLQAFQEATDSNPRSKSYRSRGRAYFRRANVQAAIDEQLKAKLQGIGINEEWWGAQVKRVVQEADRDADRLRGLELVARALGLLDSRSSKFSPQGQPVNAAELEGIERELKPLPSSR